MKEQEFGTKIFNAAKWSTVTEIAAKLVIPLTNIILARIVAPEAFGIIATITMIISFADMFTDAGFQKYLIQYEFKSNSDKYNYANVAFWTNLFMSLLLWSIIATFSGNIAAVVGNPGLGRVITLACIQLPLTSFSSIQLALYRRDFNFKTLFFVRVFALFVPIAITIPLALLGMSYWAIIIGTISTQVFNAIVLTVKSNWKPKAYYNIGILKNMLSFSIWSLGEAFSIWLTTWVDTFIIGSLLSDYFLGIYKTSTTMVNTIMSLVTASIVPVMFSALSRLQDDNDRFINLYFKMQRMISILILPLGIGIYLYSDLATDILLGSQWKEASKIIGIWALTSSIMIVFGHFCSEVYRAQGKPKLSLLAQILHLIVLIPVCIISARYGFWILIYARAIVRFQFIIVHFLIMKLAIKISIMKTLKNVLPIVISSLVMGGIGYLLGRIYTGVLWDLISIVICIFLYFSMLMLFSNMRKEVILLGKKLILNKLN
ncbi:lipopolysaccharide biosynthesis protein [Priestia sp. FSL R5-0597]|uniref:lipopolysaccharide biosynthesis protein n=1 Tax=Priestia TaxID=2800373 RepID=UPI0012B84909|nr:lipopolysaccharide biosynthesis protein [Priestia megaterium]